MKIKNVMKLVKFMGELVNLEGKVYGKLSVLSLNCVDRRAYWNCKCDCGNFTVIASYKLQSRHTKSCGCLYKKHLHSINRKPTPTYRSWQMMWQRCTNPHEIGYKYYGGRGITVCKRWEEFINFLEDMGIRPEGKTLDRIDSDRNYGPNNCKWSTPKEQANNRRIT